MLGSIIIIVLIILVIISLFKIRADEPKSSLNTQKTLDDDRKNRMNEQTLKIRKSRQEQIARRSSNTTRSPSAGTYSSNTSSNYDSGGDYSSGSSSSGSCDSGGSSSSSSSSCD